MIDFRFRRVEVIIIAVYVFTGIVAFTCSILNGKVDNAIAVMIMSIVCPLIIVIEHKKQLIFNRNANKFTIVEKALFRNEYKINKQMTLDDISGASVYSYLSRGKNCSTRMYELHINSNSEGTISPFNYAKSNSSTATKFAKKINEFLAGNEPMLTLNHAPFFGRALGIFFSIFYFLICHACITEIK